MRRAMAAVGLSLGLSSPPAVAQTVMSLEEMADTRGGVMTPWGQDIGFSAVVRTYVDGQLALESKLTWTSEGPVTSYEAGAPTADLASAAAAYGLKVAPDAQGLLAPGQNGATVVLHDFAEGRIAGLILNNADNRTVRQSTDVTLSLPGLDAAQRQMAGAAVSGQLQAALANALTGATPR